QASGELRAPRPRTAPRRVSSSPAAWAFGPFFSYHPLLTARLMRRRPAYADEDSIGQSSEVRASFRPYQRRKTQSCRIIDSVASLSQLIHFACVQISVGNIT